MAINCWDSRAAATAIWALLLLLILLLSSFNGVVVVVEDDEYFRFFSTLWLSDDTKEQDEEQHDDGLGVGKQSTLIVNGRFFGGNVFHPLLLLLFIVALVDDDDDDDLQSLFDSDFINFVVWVRWPRCRWRYNVDFTDENDGKCERISGECSSTDLANSSSYILGIVTVSSAARFFNLDKNSCWGSTRNVRPCKWSSLRRTTRSPNVRTLALHNSLEKQQYENDLQA